MQWAIGTEFTGSLNNIDIRIMIVQNKAGLQQYVDQDRLNTALRKAATELQYAPGRSTQIQFEVRRVCTLQGLYPSKHYPEAEHRTPAVWSPAPDTVCEDLHRITQTIELKHRPAQLLFTDGSCKEIPNVGLVTGSGIYRKLCSAPVSLRVEPYGEGVLNTMNRAELMATLMAHRECRSE
ncbi:hypothetical protein ABBQ38_011742 [Trebouxia sp. C0009 RCD-2024]